MHSSHCSVEAVAQFALTDKLDEKAAIVDLRSISIDLDVHLDKHLGSVQMADEQPLPTGCTQDSQRTLAAVLVSARDRGRQKH